MPNGSPKAPEKAPCYFQPSVPGEPRHCTGCWSHWVLRVAFPSVGRAMASAVFRSSPETCWLWPRNSLAGSWYWPGKCRESQVSWTTLKTSGPYFSPKIWDNWGWNATHIYLPTYAQFESWDTALSLHAVCLVNASHENAGEHPIVWSKNPRRKAFKRLQRTTYSTGSDGLPLGFHAIFRQAAVGAIATQGDTQCRRVYQNIYASGNLSSHAATPKSWKETKETRDNHSE